MSICWMLHKYAVFLFFLGITFIFTAPSLTFGDILLCLLHSNFKCFFKSAFIMLLLILFFECLYQLFYLRLNTSIIPLPRLCSYKISQRKIVLKRMWSFQFQISLSFCALLCMVGLCSGLGLSLSTSSLQSRIYWELFHPRESHESLETGNSWGSAGLEHCSWPRSCSPQVLSPA